MFERISVSLWRTREGPPCIRHLPFAIAGDRHGFPVLVLAPQRFARRISKSMGLILRFGPYPTPLNVTDNGLATGLDSDVLDPDHLLALAAMLAQRVE